MYAKIMNDLAFCREYHIINLKVIYFEVNYFQVNNYYNIESYLKLRNRISSAIILIAQLKMTAMLFTKYSADI